METNDENKAVPSVDGPTIVSGCSKRLAMEMLFADMRIAEARLSDATDHEEGIRSLHDAAKNKVSLLMSIKREMEAKIDSIYSHDADMELPPRK